MNLNDTPSANRLHIGFFGMRNAGKSSLVNAVTGQPLAVVSPVKGTTTDPVKKAMELLPLGPVVIVDTPGLDDEGNLGALRVKKARQMLEKVDLAVLVVDALVGIRPEDEALLAFLKENSLPYLVAFNKADLLEKREELPKDVLYVSAETGEGIYELKERLARMPRRVEEEKPLVSDLLVPGKPTILVIPIDASAPKGRIILPQQQVLREILDNNAICLCCQDGEVKETIESLKEKPGLVITDSQAFGRVSKDVLEDIPLTSFSILFARYKGSLPALVRGAKKLGELKDGDKVLISEGCTHHRQCNDIGTVKMPHWIREYAGCEPTFSFSSGGEFPEDLKDYSLVVHCGGCMLTPVQMQSRMRAARDAGVPVVNYGVAIAQMHGILERSLRPFPQVHEMLR